MKQMFTGILIGLAAGAVIALVVVFLAAPALFMKETSVSHDFETAVEKVMESAEAHNWKIPHVHDLQATLKNFGKDVRSVHVFELCHPEYSYEILSRNEERIVSNLMPCRIAVYEKQDGSVWLSRMNSGTVAKPMTRVVRKTMSAAAEDMEEIIADVIRE